MPPTQPGRPAIAAPCRSASPHPRPCVAVTASRRSGSSSPSARSECVARSAAPSRSRTAEAGRSATRRCAGRPFLVYFGYTHCPDVCPTELARISDVLARMGDQAIPALFITVDPERDTPKVMQDYVSSFNPAHHRALRQSAGDRRGGEGLSGVRAKRASAARRRLFHGPQFDRVPDEQDRGPSSRRSTSIGRPRMRPRTSPISLRSASLPGLPRPAGFARAASIAPTPVAPSSEM